MIFIVKLYIRILERRLEKLRKVVDDTNNKDTIEGMSLFSKEEKDTRRKSIDKLLTRVKHRLYNRSTIEKGLLIVTLPAADVEKLVWFTEAFRNDITLSTDIPLYDINDKAE